jgi:hypothetical protein
MWLLPNSRITPPSFSYCILIFFVANYFAFKFCGVGGDEPKRQDPLQAPGPSAIPERVLRAVDGRVLDHWGPDFSEAGR